jgi:hypothetical protein
VLFYSQGKNYCFLIAYSPCSDTNTVVLTQPPCDGVMLRCRLAPLCA